MTQAMTCRSQQLTALPSDVSQQAPFLILYKGAGMSSRMSACMHSMGPPMKHWLG